MEESDSAGDIAASSQSCITTFEELLQHQLAWTGKEPPEIQQFPNENESFGDFDTSNSSVQSLKAPMSLLEVENAFARFKIWAGNLGALQRGSSSLDVRLRESNVMRIAILRILSSLRETLNESKSLPTIKLLDCIPPITRNGFRGFEIESFQR